MLITLLYLISPIFIAADGITIIQSPPYHVLQGSTQPISWEVPSGVVLKSTKVDIYQNSQYRQTLGMINSAAKSFQWSVSYNAKTGNNYAIRVTATSTQGKTAWATSPTFSIVSNTNGVPGSPIVNIVVLIIATIVLVSLCGCFCKKRYVRISDRFAGNGVTSDYYTMNPPPVANAVYNTPGYNGVSAIPVNPTRTGYSTGTVAGAALAGMVGGVVLDEALHHGDRHHGGNHQGFSDFGGGTFDTGGDFGGDFGGNGDNGDNGGSF